MLFDILIETKVCVCPWIALFEILMANRALSCCVVQCWFLVTEGGIDPLQWLLSIPSTLPKSFCHRWSFFSHFIALQYSTVQMYTGINSVPLRQCRPMSHIVYGAFWLISHHEWTDIPIRKENLKTRSPYDLLSFSNTMRFVNSAI